MARRRHHQLPSAVPKRALDAATSMRANKEVAVMGKVATRTGAHRASSCALRGALAALSIVSASPAFAQPVTPYDLGIHVPPVPDVQPGQVLTITINVANRDTAALPITPPDNPPINVRAFGDKSAFQIVKAHWLTSAGPVDCMLGGGPIRTNADCFVPDVNASWPAGANRVVQVTEKIVAPPPAPGTSGTIWFCAKQTVDSSQWTDQSDVSASRNRHCRRINLVT